MVDTDAAREIAVRLPEFKAVLDKMGLKPAAVEDGSRLVLDQIDKATRETSGFVNEKGETVPW
jgi:hypothetical protein